MKKIKTILFSFLSILVSFNSYSQDFLFSQYHKAGYLISPSVIGIGGSQLYLNTKFKDFTNEGLSKNNITSLGGCKEINSLNLRLGLFYENINNSSFVIPINFIIASWSDWNIIPGLAYKFSPQYNESRILSSLYFQRRKDKFCQDVSINNDMPVKKEINTSDSIIKSSASYSIIGRCSYVLSRHPLRVTIYLSGFYEYNPDKTRFDIGSYLKIQKKCSFDGNVKKLGKSYILGIWYKLNKSTIPINQLVYYLSYEVQKGPTYSLSFDHSISNDSPSAIEFSIAVPFNYNDLAWKRKYSRKWKSQHKTIKKQKLNSCPRAGCSRW